MVNELQCAISYANRVPKKARSNSLKMSTDSCETAEGLLLDIDFANELRILPTVQRSGRSELLIFSNPIAKKPCITAISGKTNYLPLSGLRTNGHSKKVQLWGTRCQRKSRSILL
jgi:hypothetical protein